MSNREMGIREERGFRREVTLVEGAIRMNGILGGRRGMGRKFGIQNFVEMNVQRL